MKNTFYARKTRQLKYRIKLLKKYSAYSSENKSKLQQLIHEIKYLIQELKHVVSRTRMRKIIGGATMLLGLGLGPVAEAQQFGERQVNPFGINPIATNSVPPTLCDLDGDGDFDLLVSDYDGGIVFHENVGTAQVPSFATGILDQFGLPNQQYIVPLFGDFDNDGDLDMLALTEDDGANYYENTGTANAPSFSGTPIINAFNLPSDYSLLGQIADIDNDGDLDLFSPGEYGMLFFENEGTPQAPNFAAPINNAFGLNPPDSSYINIEFSDIDLDGDLDMLGAEIYNLNGGDPNFYFQRNIGDAQNPAFAAREANPFGLQPVQNAYFSFPTMADLDGDGDEDLLVSAYIDGGNGLEFGYYELLSTVETENIISDQSTTIFPNPTSAILTIESDITFESFEIYDIVGRKVIVENFNVQNISTKSLTSGTYILKLKTENNEIVVKRFEKI